MITVTSDTDRELQDWDIFSNTPCSTNSRFMGHAACGIPDSEVHGVYMGPTGPRWAPCWSHVPCYLRTLSNRTLYCNIKTEPTVCWFEIRGTELLWDTSNVNSKMNMFFFRLVISHIKIPCCTYIWYILRLVKVLLKWMAYLGARA